ncbi:MAG: hypothetical protein GY765_01365, partial [bacterium]|nr:hypothetical protein [bacterium]
MGSEQRQGSQGFQRARISVNAVAFSGDGNRIVSGSSDYTLRLWDVASGREIRTFTGHTGSILSVAFSVDGETVVSASKDKTLRLWDANSGRKIRTFKGHTEWVRSVAFAGDGKTFVSASDDATLRLWEVKSGREIRTFTGYPHWVGAVAFSGDGKNFIFVNNYKTIHLWNASSGREIRTFKGHTEWIKSVAFRGDGKAFVSASIDKTLRLWDVASGRKIKTFTGHTNAVWSVAFSGDGKTFVSAGYDNTLRLWDASSGREIRTFTGHTDHVLSVAFSGDGKTFVSASDDDTLRLWNINSSREIRVITDNSMWVRSVAISADGQTVVSAYEDKRLRLHHVKSGREIRVFNGHTDWVNSVAFGGDGKTFVSASDDNTLSLWSVNRGRKIRTFTGHTRKVNSVAFNCDGKTFISGSSDGEVKIWDAQKGSIIASFVALPDGQWLAYTPDNYYVASSEADKHFHFRVNNKSFDTAKYAAKYNNSGIISLRLREIGSAEPTTAPVISPHISTQETESQATTPAETPPERKTSTTTSPPIIVINYLQNGKRTFDDLKQTVEFPDIHVNATILDKESGLSKLTISMNNNTVFSKNISGKEFKLKHQIKLQDKTNRILLIAHNRSGLKTVSREITLTYRNELLKGLDVHELAKRVFGKKRSWAVIIGIDQYTKTKNGYIPLPYAVNDARAVRECFIKSLGFAEDHIITLTNRQATRKRIEEVLGDELPKKTGDGDRVIIYFSGHGDQEKVNSGRFGYLVPIDGRKASLYSTCISMDQLRYFSRKNPARQILFILDSCFSGIAGTVFKKGTADSITKETREQIKAFIESGGRQIITAGKANQTAAMSAKWNKHSVFTFFLLRGLRGKADYNKDKVVSVRELQLFLETEVPKESKQLPQLFNLNNSEGQFVFYR